MAEKIVSKMEPKKAKGFLGELDVKIRNNRKRISALNKKFEARVNGVHVEARDSPKNSKKIKAFESETEKLKKQEKKDRRRIMKLERKTKSAVDDLNAVKTLQFKDFEALKRKVNEQSDFIEKEALRLNEALDTVQKGIAAKGTVSKTIVSSGKSTVSSASSVLSNEEKALRLVSLYFQEIARTGFKKSLTLSEIINAYQYVLGRLEGVSPSEKPVKETVVKEEKVSKEAENLMEDIGKLKASIDAKALKKIPERELKGFAYTNKKGVTYYLHNKGKLYYFSKDPMHAVDKPAERFVVENKQTGLPILKKK